MSKIITEDMIEKVAVELLISEYVPYYTRLDYYTEKRTADERCRNAYGDALEDNFYRYQ